MSLKARYELLAVTAPRYQKATKKEKQQILDEFIKVTSYHRKYAITLLRQWHVKEPSTITKKRRKRAKEYDEAVQEPLLIIWKAANCICSKRLVPCIPLFIDALERHGHLQVTGEVRKKLLSISASTIDRLLGPIRRGIGARGIGTTKPGELLKNQIPIRTFADWDDKRPGWLY